MPHAAQNSAISPDASSVLASEPCSAFLTVDQAASLHYGQRIWHAASDAQMCRRGKKGKFANGQAAVSAEWLFGTVHEVNDRGVQICPDGARKGTHIWFCGWLQIRVDAPPQSYVYLDERRFGDSTPRAEVHWQNDKHSNRGSEI